ncbi:MAG: hypothetical protein WC549_05795 [Actinomycetota bacterium]
MIKKDYMGIVDSHSHLWIDEVDSSCKKNCSAPAINGLAVIKRELKKYKDTKINSISNGYTSIIDCQPGYCGRNGNKLFELSELTGVNIISVTGFHKKEYYGPYSQLWKMNRKNAAFFFEDEVKNSLAETSGSGYKNSRIRAGAIKIAFTGALEGQYRTLTEAAVDTSLTTGVPLVVHTERGLEVEKLISFFEKMEIPFSKIMLCHMDKRADIKLHKYLADKSIYLEYDTFNRSKYDPEKNVWPLLIEMIREGYSSSVMIGSDLANNLSWNEINNKGGLAGFFKSITERLARSGAGTADIENIIKKNTQNFLSFD